MRPATRLEAFDDFTDAPDDTSVGARGDAGVPARAGRGVPYAAATRNGSVGGICDMHPECTTVSKWCGAGGCKSSYQDHAVAILAIAPHSPRREFFRSSRQMPCATRDVQPVSLSLLR